MVPAQRPVQLGLPGLPVRNRAAPLQAAQQEQAARRTVVHPLVALRVAHREQAVLQVVAPQVAPRAEEVVLPVAGVPAALSQQSVALPVVAHLP